jgi:hypothetical protein
LKAASLPARVEPPKKQTIRKSKEALIYSIENSPTMLAANYVGAISAPLTQGPQSLPHLRNEMSKYIRETGKLCLPSMSVKLISVSLTALSRFIPFYPA